MDLHVCIISTEFYGDKSRGGFGAATRSIGMGLAKRGIRVTVVVPSINNKPCEVEIEGLTVHYHSIHEYPFIGRLFYSLDADVYHSEEPSWGTKIAYDNVKDKVHVATCQNPKTQKDWKLVESYYPVRRKIFNFILGDSIIKCISGLHSVYCQARYVIPKARLLYNLNYDPGFLPNPVKIHESLSKKPSEPTVLFLGRFDREKSPETFFEVARRHPSIRFVAAGMANDGVRDSKLRNQYGRIHNLELPGHLEDKEKIQLLEKSWILVNTSVSECLPVSFLEAAANGCAILSRHDPDGFASNFGYHVRGGEYDLGLRWLLDEERWRVRGARGRKYVSEVHEFDKVIDQHIDEYERLLSSPHSSS